MEEMDRIVMEKMTASDLEFHPKAQRAINPQYVNRLMRQFDLDAVGTIHAVRYQVNGLVHTYVVDGQHRIDAMKKLGMGDWLVNVGIHTQITNDAAASKLFLRLNSRLSVYPYYKYLNEVNAEDPVAMGVDQILTNFGLRMGRNAAEGILACPISLKKCFRMDRGQTLKTSIDILTEAFGKKPAALDGKLIEGMSIVMVKNNGTVDGGLMVEKLKNYVGGPSTLMSDAKGWVHLHHLGSLPQAAAAIIVDAYNRGRSKTNRIKL